MLSLTVDASKPPSNGPYRAIDLLGHIFRFPSITRGMARGRTFQPSSQLQAGVLELGMLPASSKCWGLFC